MDFFDELRTLLPFIIFVLITVLGNLGDKKKPKVKMKTKPFPKGQKLPDIRPPASKEQDSVQLQVHNPYQSYLEKKYQQEDLAQAETLKAAAEDIQVGQEKAKQSGKLMGLENLSLAQAILSAEILGQPRCRQRRIR